MSKWNGNRFSVYTSEEKSVLGLIKEMGDQTNYNTDEIERLTESDNKKVSHQEMQEVYKIDKQANFTGSWFGIKKPTQSSEGLAATVDQLIDETIPGINSQLEQILNNETILLLKPTNQDDTDNIKSYILNAVNQNKELVLSEGRFTISETISIPSNLKIRIIGSINSALSKDIFILNNVENVIVNQGYLIGDGSTTSQNGIVIKGTSKNNIFNNITLENFLNKGIDVKENANNNKFTNIKVSGSNSSTGVGISLFGANVTSNTFNFITCFNNRIGISVNGGSYNIINNVYANENQTGIMVDGIVTASGDGGKNNMFTNIVANNNTSTSYGGIYLGNGSSNNKFINITTNNNKGGGIRISGGEGYENINNSFENIECINNSEGGFINTYAPNTKILNFNVSDNLKRGYTSYKSDYSLLQNGTVQRNATEGLFSQSAYLNVSNLTITNNNIGIQIAYGGSTGTHNLNNIYIKDNLTNNIIQAYTNNLSCISGTVLENKGSILKSNGQTIAHGLSTTPSYIEVTPSVSNRLVSVTNKNETTFTISLTDNTGSAITSAETIYWKAIV